MAARLMQLDKTKQKVAVTVTSESLQWSFFADTFQKYTLKSSQILTTEVAQDSSTTYVVVHYVKVVMPTKETVLLRRDVITFMGSDDDCRAICHDVTKLLQDNESHRPQRLLVFVNPMSGSQDGVQRYRNVVSPIFTLCNIDCHLIETENVDHAATVLRDYDLSSIDGAVSVGGDGSINQVIRGLFERTCKDFEIDISDERANLMEPPVPIGIIPSGSGSGFAFQANGTIDIESCALNIVLGTTTKADVLILRNHGQFIGYGNILEQIGLPASCFHYLERMRWLSKHRYRLYPFLAWWLMREFDVEIEFLPVTENKEFQLDPSAVVEDSVNDVFVDGSLPGWKTYRGSILGMNIIPWPQREFIKNMFHPTYSEPNLSTSGKFIVAIIKSQSYSQMMKSLGMSARRGRPYLPSNSVLHLEVKECRVKALTSWSDPSLGDFIGLDGDIQYLKNGQQLEVSVQSGVTKFFCINDDLVSEARPFLL